MSTIEWRKLAACAGSRLDFFYLYESNRDAVLEVCGRCGVADECLEYSLETNERFGVWGGTLPRDRIPMLRQIREAS